MTPIARTLATVLLAALLGACWRAEPPEPAIGFAAAALPHDASRDAVLARGGRRLDAASVGRIIGALGNRGFLGAIDAGTAERLVLRDDGAVCLEERPLASCRVVVADGRTYRLFDLDGRPRGTLTPSEG